MKILLVVHGFVQGVGYRAFVKGRAGAHGIRGYVRNMPDGSVEVFAVAEPEALKAFEASINIYAGTGPKVMQIDKFTEDNSRMPDFSLEKGFVILH